jgi:Uma2 family endonuclease
LPVIIVEIMSPSSEADDAGRKCFSCRKIPSLKRYLVLSQDERAVQVHSGGRRALTRALRQRRQERARRPARPA